MHLETMQKTTRNKQIEHSPVNARRSKQGTGKGTTKQTNDKKTKKRSASTSRTSLCVFLRSGLILYIRENEPGYSIIDEAVRGEQ